MKRNRSNQRKDDSCSNKVFTELKTVAEFNLKTMKKVQGAGTYDEALSIGRIKWPNK